MVNPFWYLPNAMHLAIIPSIHRNIPLPEIHLCLIDLLHELVVCFRHIVEGEDAVAELEEEECAEGDDGPDWQLQRPSVTGAVSCSSEVYIPRG